MVIGFSREYIAVSAGSCPFCAIEQQYGIGLKLRICPGIVGYITVHMIIMIGNAYIINTDRPGKGKDLGNRIVGRFLAVP